MEAHLAWQHNKVGIKAVYAQWNINGMTFKQQGTDKQYGGYLEGSYKLTPKLGLFSRFSRWDNYAGNNDDTATNQWDIGFNYWLAERVVLKADYVNQTGARDGDGFNLGVGWSF